MDKNLELFIFGICKLFGGEYPITHCRLCATRAAEHALLIACPEIADADPRVKAMIERQLTPIIVAHLIADRAEYLA